MTDIKITTTITSTVPVTEDGLGSVEHDVDVVGENVATEELGQALLEGQARTLLQAVLDQQVKGEE